LDAKKNIKICYHSIMLEKLNQRIVRMPGTVWVWGLLTVAILGMIFREVPVIFVPLVILFWLSNPYICYIAARGLNRNAIGWAIFGCFFIPLPIIIIAHLAGKGPLPSKTSE